MSFTKWGFPCHGSSAPASPRKAGQNTSPETSRGLVATKTTGNRKRVLRKRTETFNSRAANPGTSCPRASKALKSRPQEASEGQKQGPTQLPASPGTEPWPLGPPRATHTLTSRSRDPGWHSALRSGPGDGRDPRVHLPSPLLADGRRAGPARGDSDRSAASGRSPPSRYWPQLSQSPRRHPTRATRRPGHHPTESTGAGPRLSRELAAPHCTR